MTDRTPTPGKADVANERAVESRYRRALEAQRRPVAFQGPRNGQWTGTGVPHAALPATGELLGRVALDGPHEWVGSADFYIGDRHLEQEGLTVFSWAAPVACTFFRGLDHHPLCSRAVAVRTFVRRQGQIVQVEEEALVDPPPTSPFARRALVIPQPPTRAPLPAEATPPTPSRPGAPDSSSSHSATPGLFSHAPTAPPPLADEVRKSPPASPRGGMRAAGALHGKVTAPRGERMSSVLSTLQPDQYDLVARPADVALFVQGHPGTGKTVIATHRAAFLAAPERGGDRVKEILLVGPTPAYVSHVEGVVHTLVPRDAHVEVVSMPQLLAEMRGRKHELSGDLHRDFHDCSERLAVLVDDAARWLRTHGGLPTGAANSAIAIYETLRSNGTPNHPITKDAEWIEYMRALPRYNDAQAHRSLNALLAACAWAAKPNPRLKRFGHVIVDEAQDVLPLEWALLDKLNVAERWTLVGDVNQRRSDWGFASWDRVASLLGCLVDGAAPLSVLERGYRSTEAILRFANRLLAKHDRAVVPLQRSGPEPTVRRVPEAALSAEVVQEAVRLIGRHASGTIAVISVDSAAVREELRRRGWTARGGVREWQRIGQRLIVTHPDVARGLEFDAVVVAEPADFPTNLGRHGLLYTSLTRANRELAVVHSKPLPEPLRGR